MAVIYKAEDLRLKRQVAVKILNENLAKEKEVLSRFLREAQSAAKLIHPNIVNVYDIEEDKGIHYIVMEYVDAKSLKDIMQKQFRFDIQSVLNIFQQIAASVKFAHDNGIIHRDLKPQNVLVTDQGVIKVTDFGIARAVSASSLTQTGTMMGTVQYFSPEQAQGKHVDKTTDIYSLGIMLFEVLTGRLPFEGDNLVAIALKQVQEDPPIPSSINKDITPSIDGLILKALSKNPGDRYQDMDEFIAAMESAFSNKDSKDNPLAAASPTPQEETLLMASKFAGSVNANSSPKLNTFEDEENEDEGYEEEDDEEESLKKGPPIFTLILVMFLFVITYTLYIRGDLSLLFGQDTVPDLEGLTLTDARQRVDKKGWQIQIVEEVFHPRMPEGVIISQNPPLGEKLARGGTISVSISKGDTRIEVPDLTGLSLDQARIKLGESNLGWVIQDSIFSETVQKDIIISQDPPAGEETAPGRKINLIISKGAAQIDVPDLMGMDEEKARAEAVKRGLNILVNNKEFSSSYPEGQVISQEPLPGKQVDRGTRIFVVLSKGAEVLLSPRLIGKTLGEAMEMLDTLKLRLDVSDGTTDKNAIIIGQEPPPGVEMENKILEVWCQDNIEVPHLTGITLEDAQNRLDKAGFNVRIRYVDSVEVEQGYVIQQDPEAGVNVNRGTQVTISISKKPEVPKVEQDPIIKPTPSPSPVNGVLIPEIISSPSPAPHNEEEIEGVELIR